MIEDLIRFPHQHPGRGWIGERQVDAGELDPSLDGLMRDRVGQHVPAALAAEEFPARRLDISPVQRCAGLRRAGEQHFDPDRAQDCACLVGQDPGLVPLVAGHRQQRPLGQRDRDSLGDLACLPHADRILPVCVAAIEVAAKEARDSLEQRG